MADDKSRSGPDETQDIDVNSEADVTYWADKLNLTPERLRELVLELGPKLQDIQRAIGKYTPTGNPR